MAAEEQPEIGFNKRVSTYVRICHKEGRLCVRRVYGRAAMASLMPSEVSAEYVVKMESPICIGVGY